MEIDNQRKSITLKLRKFMFLLFFVLSIIVIHFTNIWAEPHLGITRLHLTLFLIGIIILYYIIEFALNFQYIYFSDHGEKIVLRYYSLRPMQNLKNSIEIPKSNFVRFEILPSIFNLKPSVILYAKSKNSIAKYPPVCLSALTSSERKKLIQALQRWAPQT